MSDNTTPLMDVFVVDEGRVIAHTLGIILRQAGYNVRVFPDAVAAAACLHTRPRLIISDEQMPGPGGCDLARYAATEASETKLLLVSSSLEISDTAWGQVSRYSREAKLLAKPLHPSQLLSSVEEMIGRPASSTVEQSGQVL